jgi:hypothetical protein
MHLDYVCGALFTGYTYGTKVLWYMHFGALTYSVVLVDLYQFEGH